jgi:quercetin dioxygenase-like cupin family protein
MHKLSVSLPALVEHMLARAQTASSGHSVQRLYGGSDQMLEQSVIALCAGHRLAEHDYSGEGTVFVLHGRVRLAAGDISWDGSAGDLLIIPGDQHTLRALEPAVVLRTVATCR